MMNISPNNYYNARLSRDGARLFVGAFELREGTGDVVVHIHGSIAKFITTYTVHGRGYVQHCTLESRDGWSWTRRDSEPAIYRTSKANIALERRAINAAREVIGNSPTAADIAADACFAAVFED